MTMTEYEARKARGECPRCKGTPKPGGVCCVACIAYAQERQAQNPERERARLKDQRRRRRGSRRCVRCGRRSVPKATKCAACLGAAQRWKQNAGFVAALYAAAGS